MVRSMLSCHGVCAVQGQSVPAVGWWLRPDGATPEQCVRWSGPRRCGADPTASQVFPLISPPSLSLSQLYSRRVQRQKVFSITRPAHGGAEAGFRIHVLKEKGGPKPPSFISASALYAVTSSAIPWWRSKASNCGSRPRKALKLSIALRLPPISRMLCRYFCAVVWLALPSAPWVSSKAA